MKRQSEKALLRGAPRAVAPLAADMTRLGGELASLTSRARELAALAAGRALTDGEAAEAARLEADGARLTRELRALRREFDAASRE